MRKLILTILISLFFGSFGYVSSTPLRNSYPESGGTGTSTPPTYGDILVGNSNGTYDVVATSTIVGGFQTPWLQDINAASYSLNNLTSVLFDTTPTVTHTEGQLHWNDDFKTLEVDTVGGLQMILSGHIRARNVTGADIAKLRVVYISGASGNNPTIALADKDSHPSANGILGITAEAINNNNFGMVFTRDFIINVDTSTWTVGTLLYLGDDGVLTSTKAPAPAHASRVAKVIVSNATTGRIMVMIDTGSDMSELHDVLISSLLDKQMLYYDGASTTWKNTVGMIWDEANDRLGIGTTDPIAMLTVDGGSTSAGTALGDAQLADFGGYINSPYVSFGEYQNYLLQTEVFSSASWVEVNIPVVVSNSAIGPDGTGIAENLEAEIVKDGTGEIKQTITEGTTGNWTFSVWLRAQTGTANINLRIDTNSETGTVKPIALTTAWKRYAVTQNFTVAHTSKIVHILNGDNAVSAWGAQLEPADRARTYSGAVAATALTALTRTQKIRGALQILGAFSGATTGAFSSTITNTRSAIVAVSTDGYVGINSTAATAGVPVQMSPRIRLTGAAWESGAGVSTTTSWIIENLPVTGATASSSLNFSVDGATGYQKQLSISNTGNFIIGNPGFETSGISLSGLTQTSNGYFNDIGGDDRNMLILHRHSTQFAPVILGARANSETSSHADITASQSLLTLTGSGWTTSSYKPAATIDLTVDSTGTISDTSLPGKISFKVSPSGAIVPVEVMTIINNGNVGIGSTTPSQNLTVNSTAGNAGLLLSGGLSGGTSTYFLNTVGDTSIGKIAFQKSLVTKGFISYNHAATAAAEALVFDVDGGSTDMTILGNGRVGIGTTTPSGILTMLGTGEQLRLSYNQTNYSTLTTDSSGDLTITPSGGDASMPSSLLVQPTSAAVSILRIFGATVDSSILNANAEITEIDTNGRTAFTFSPDMTFSTTTSQGHYGLFNATNLKSDGIATPNLSSFTNFYSRTDHDAGFNGTTTALYGYYVANSLKNSGVITTQYGYYAPALTSGASNYAFYSAGAATPSYFGYNVGIGTTSPYAKLSVVGETVSTNFTANSTTATSTFASVAYTGNFAEIYLSDASTAQSIPTGTTYTKLTGFTTDGEFSNSRADSANDRIILTRAGKYKVTGTINASVGTINTVWRGAVFVGGTEHSDIHFKETFTALADTHTIPFSGIITATSSSNIDVRVRHDNAGSVDFTPEYGNLNVMYIGE